MFFLLQPQFFKQVWPGFTGFTWCTLTKSTYIIKSAAYLSHTKASWIFIDKKITSFFLLMKSYQQFKEFIYNILIETLSCASVIFVIYRSSHSEVFLRKGVLEICSKFAGEHPCRSAIPIKLQSNLIQIALRRGCSTVNFLHIFRTSIPRTTPVWLLLNLLNVVYQVA